MGASIVPLTIFTFLFGAIGIGLPMMVPKGPNQSLIRCILMLTAACCWLFWLCCYMAQMNPLIGPKLHQRAIYMIAREWGMDLTNG